MNRKQKIKNKKIKIQEVWLEWQQLHESCLVQNMRKPKNQIQNSELLQLRTIELLNY